MKRIIGYLLIFVIVMIISGCATTTRTVGGAAYGFGTGVAKDSKDTADAIMKADKWFRENCW
jgi:uncharacterized protein YceK